MEKFFQRIKKIGGGDWKASALQFIKFGLVGASNTAISYAIELLFYYVVLTDPAMPDNLRVIITSVVQFVVSVTNSYIWNNRFVFKSGEKKGWAAHLRAYLKTVICYGLTGLVVSPALKVFLVDSGVPFYLASPATLIVSIPLNFLLNKFWAFRG